MVWEAHSAAVYSLCSNDKFLFSTSNKVFKVWDFESSRCINEINAHDSFIKASILWPERQKFLKKNYKLLFFFSQFFAHNLFRNAYIIACDKLISVWDLNRMNVN